MDYNLAGLRNNIIQDRLDDDEFDQGTVDGFINDSIKEIFNQFELPFQEKIFAGVLPATSTIFALPKDLVQLQDAIITSPADEATNLMDKYTDFREFNKYFTTPSTSESGGVETWTLYAGNIMLSRPTDKDYELTLFYIKKPKKLELDTDVPEIPEEFSELIILGAYMRCLKKNEDFDIATYVENDYNKELDLLVSKYGYRKAGAIKMKNRQIPLRRR